MILQEAGQQMTGLEIGMAKRKPWEKPGGASLECGLARGWATYIRIRDWQCQAQALRAYSLLGEKLHAKHAICASQEPDRLRSALLAGSPGGGGYCSGFQGLGLCSMTPYSGEVA